jgi:hypothetical protein
MLMGTLCMRLHLLLVSGSTPNRDANYVGFSFCSGRVWYGEEYKHLTSHN